MEDKERGVVLVGGGHIGLGRYYWHVLGHIDPGFTSVTECKVEDKVMPSYDFGEMMPKLMDFKIMASRQQRRKLERENKSCKK